jgi:hypothetical protein
MLRLAIKKTGMLCRNMEYNNMRELSVNEVQEVNGGVPAIIVGMLGAYIYESVGGAQGINTYLENSRASFSSAWNYHFH